MAKKIKGYYKAKAGAFFNDEKAVLYGQELEKIAAENNGEVLANVVVERAADPENPLHDYFNWDDAWAARLYRETEARSLIRKIVYVIVSEDGQEHEQRAFINVTINENDNDPVYVPVGRVIADKELRAQVIRRALAELVSWKARYERYRELDDICEAIEGIAKRLNFEGTKGQAQETSAALGA